MPWKPMDARKHTKAATTMRKAEKWATVANSALKEYGDEGKAIRIANASIKPKKRR